MTLVGALVLMAVLDAVLLGVALGVLVAVGLAIGLVLPRILRAAERQQVAVGALGAALERALGALRTVKASGAEARETAVVEGAARAAYESGLRSAGYQALVGTPPASSSRSPSSRSWAWAARGSRAEGCRSGT